VLDERSAINPKARGGHAAAAAWPVGGKQAKQQILVGGPLTRPRVLAYGTDRK